MQIIRYLPSRHYEPTAIAIGNFDGLHLGHKALITSMVKAARISRAEPSVLTFEPHPRKFFMPDAPDFRITPLRDKFALLRNMGIRNAFVPRFDATMAMMLPEDFMNRVLLRQLNAKVVVTGEDFLFGSKRRGNVAMLKTWGQVNNVKVVTVPPVMVGEQVCSSSLVRGALMAGDMKKVVELLGRPYRMNGHVVHGAGKGREFGFPTANLSYPSNLLLPAFGVYAVRTVIDGHTYDGVANLGIRPTVSVDNQPLFEIHLFDFVRDIYGKILQVELVDYLRPERKFEGIEALKNQIAQDCDMARQVLRKAA